ncbi:MAG: DUF4097 family beta strand repeat protein [Chloroflexi bacterium]|nr:DUF4097 family beta strand repeat protein [Chloroflexota bacterium]
MSDKSRTIPISHRAHLHVSTRSGRVTITAEEREDFLIESDVPLRDDKISIDPAERVSIKSGRGGSGWLEIRCPLGADISIGTVSGTVELRGEFDAVRVTTISGSITIDRAELVDARSVSGNIEVQRCSGHCRLRTKSGRISCESAGVAQVSTLSGRIHLGEVTGDVHAQSASGRIEVGMQGSGDVTAQTMSGAVKIEVPPGVHPSPKLRSLSGRPRFDCEEGDDCKIRVRSLSGKIEVLPS